MALGRGLLLLPLLRLPIGVLGVAPVVQKACYLDSVQLLHGHGGDVAAGGTKRGSGADAGWWWDGLGLEGCLGALTSTRTHMGVGCSRTGILPLLSLCLLVGGVKCAGAIQLTYVSRDCNGTPLYMLLLLLQVGCVLGSVVGLRMCV